MTTSTTGAPSHTYNPTSGCRCIAPTYASDLDVLPPHAAALREDARSLTAGLTDAQFNWKPSPERWSIAQCIKHLVLTGGMAAAEQEAAIAKLERAGKRSVGPYRYGGISAKMGSMLMSGVEPPVQKRFKTARKVYPAEHHSRDALVEDFLNIYERLERLIGRAKGLDLGAASVGLPVPIFHMKLGQSIPFELAHARRHLWQARQVRNEAAFPAS
jgi:DinB family protein